VINRYRYKDRIEKMLEENSLLINEFKFDNIYYSAVNNKNERKQILTNISAFTYSGQVFAILGPSGNFNHS